MSKDLEANSAKTAEVRADAGSESLFHGLRLDYTRWQAVRVLWRSRRFLVWPKGRVVSELRCLRRWYRTERRLGHSRRNAARIAWLTARIRIGDYRMACLRRRISAVHTRGVVCSCGHNWSRHGTGSGCWDCDCRKNRTAE